MQRVSFKKGSLNALFVYSGELKARFEIGAAEPNALVLDLNFGILRTRLGFPLEIFYCQDESAVSTDLLTIPPDERPWRAPRRLLDVLPELASDLEAYQRVHSLRSSQQRLLEHAIKGVREISEFRKGRT